MFPIIVEKLAVWSSEPTQKNPHARILIVHGMSEHSGRYVNLEHFFLESGFSVVRFDLRGAGRSGGRRQWIEKFEDYVDDVSTVYRWICRELDPLPLFILGHSLGGAITISFLEHYQKAFSGCILSAPAFKVGEAVNPLTIAIGRQLVKILPTLRISGNSDKSAISRDPEVVKSFLEDPLCCHTNTANQGKEILDQLPKLPSIATKLTLPTLIAHGSLDKIIKLEGSFELLKCLSSPDRTLHIIPGGYHEPHNDIGKEDYFSALILWLNRQLLSFN
jgi:alpha-beta hydrolase superfamily lysophospholipase